LEEDEDFPIKDKTKNERRRAGRLADKREHKGTRIREVNYTDYTVKHRNKIFYQTEDDE
jgi:hypothetical protein